MTLGISAGAQPGPLQALFLSHTMKNGWRRTLPAAAAPLISDVPIVGLVLFALAQLPEGFLSIMQTVGGVFILYLAWSSFQSFRASTNSESGDKDSAAASQGILKAALTNFFNPAPYLFWATLAGPLVLKAWSESPSWGVSFVVGFYGVFIGLNVLMIVLFGFAADLGPKVTKWLQGFSAIALCILGIYQLWSGISQFLTRASSL
jgi:threonine/homoserine/homoserine lactone efflux protein